MTSPPTTEPPDAPLKPGRSPLIEIGLGAAWLLGTAAALQILERLLGSSMLALAVTGAVIVDTAAAWSGARWDVDARRSLREAAALIGRGAGVAVALAALTLAALAALGACRVGLARPSPMLVVAAARAAAIGVRDELLYRVIPLSAAARAGVPAPIARAFAALTSAAAIALVPGASLPAVALAATFGLLCATLYERDQGAWSAVGAHGAFVFIVGPLFRGGLLDVTYRSGDLTLGPKAAAAPALVAGAASLAFAYALIALPPAASPSPPKP